MKPLPKSALTRWRLALASSFIATTVGWSAPATAQGWLADRRFNEGPGIKAGDLELHPGIGAEAGYDSNWFLRSSNTGPTLVNGAPINPPADAASIRITPSFYVSTISTERIVESGQTPTPRFFQFRGGVSATGRIMIGKEMSDQQSIGLNADARGDFNAGHPVAFGVFGAYGRIIQPNVLTDPNFAFDRDDFRIGTDVTFLPGGGTLDMRLGYQFYASLYEETAGVPYSSLTHEIFFKDRWKFRPRTAVFSEAALDFVDYPDAQRASFYLNDSTPLRTRAGLTGLLSDWFGATLAGGYSATFFKNPVAASTTQYDSFNAQADAIFYLGKGNTGADLPGDATLLLSTVTLGFNRDFQRSLLGNFYTSDRAFARIEYWFGGRVVLNAEVGGERLDYPHVYFAGFNGQPILQTQPGGGGIGVSPFTNYRLNGHLFAEYRFSDNFGLNTTIDYVRQFSDTLLPAGPLPGQPSSNGFYDQNYGRLQAFLGFRYFY